MTKSTRRAFLSSVVALIICLTMLIGTTFAWFTDTASTAVNTIVSGTLKVDLEMYTDDGWVTAEGKTLNFVKAEGHENEEILWEPGCTYNLPKLRVVNDGNLALQYCFVLSFANATENDNGRTLADVLTLSISDYVNTSDSNILEDAVFYGTLLPDATSEELELSLTWNPTANDNDYQGLSIDGVAITVYATQYTYEFDSTTDQYDKDATLPIPATADELATALAGSDDVNVVLSAGTYTLPAAANKSVTIHGTTDTVIDMVHSAMTSAGVYTAGLDITFEGVTVKFANEDYKGIQHAAKVVYENCVIEGRQTMYAKNVVFKNCTFINSDDYCVWTYGSDNATFENCEFYTGGKAILIYGEDATHTNNVTVNNCKFYDNGNLNTVKAAIEIGDSKPTAGLHVNLTATNNAIYGFDYNVEGIATGNKLWGNKDSIPADRLNVTANNNTEYNATAVSTMPTESFTTDVVLTDDVSGDATVQAVYTNSFVAFVLNRADFDGNGNTVTVNNGGIGIQTNGGNIKNVTVKDAFRGIYINQIASDLYISNVVLDGGYGINTAEAGGNYSVYITDSTLKGWNSWSNVDSVNFTDCTFAKGSYWNDDEYNQYLRPYVESTFTGCDFAEGMHLDIKELIKYEATATFTNCTCNGVELTADNVYTYLHIYLNANDTEPTSSADFAGVLLFN